MLEAIDVASEEELGGATSRRSEWRLIEGRVDEYGEVVMFDVCWD